MCRSGRVKCGCADLRSILVSTDMKTMQSLPIQMRATLISLRHKEQLRLKMKRYRINTKSSKYKDRQSENSKDEEDEVKEVPDTWGIIDGIFNFITDY